MQNKLVQYLAFIINGLVLLFNASAVLASETDTEPAAWLLRMAQEAKTLNYTGVISYQYGDHLLSAKIYQRYENGQGQRRLVYLDGAQDELIHQGDQLKFVINSGEKSPVSQLKNQEIKGNINSLPERLAKLGDAYSLQNIGTQHIAGREAVVIKIKPSDPLRYAHTLFIDTKTALLLKSETIDANAKPLERFQFVQIDINGKNPIAAKAMQPSAHKIQHSKVNTVRFMPRAGRNQPLPWSISWKPKGYVLVNSNHDSAKSSNCMYSDGMSSFSVFVEPYKENYSGGVMRQGASIVLSRAIKINNETKVATVAGDIPLTTAERIIKSIRAQDK